MVFFALMVNFTQTKNESINSSLAELNMLAVANAESSFVQCNQPPRTACYIDPDDYTVLQGVRIQ